jgi:hypothetical protein
MKTPIEYLIDELNSIVTINISDVEKFNKIIVEARRMEEEHLSIAYDSGIEYMVDRLDSSINLTYSNNYFKNQYRK